MTALILDPSFVERICTYPPIVVFFVISMLKKILLTFFFIALFQFFAGGVFR